MVKTLSKLEMLINILTKRNECLSEFYVNLTIFGLLKLIHTFWSWTDIEKLIMVDFQEGLGPRKVIVGTLGCK